MSDPRKEIDTVILNALRRSLEGTGWQLAPEPPDVGPAQPPAVKSPTFPSGYTYPTSGLYVHAPKNGDPNPATVGYPRRDYSVTGLDPEDPIKDHTQTPKVPVTFQQGHELDVEFFRYAESPTVRPDGPTVEQVRTRTPDWKHVDFASEATLKPAAPFYEHNEALVKHLRSEVSIQKAVIATLDAQNAQLVFLLSQAPIRTAPADLREAAHSVTKYAYINRKTFRHATREVFASERWTEPYYTIAPSPTKWVMTDLMPVGTVIYSPNAMPALEGQNHATEY